MSTGRHWLALDWLESGWPIRDVLDVLADMKDSRALSQPLRHSCLVQRRTSWLAAVHDSTRTLGGTAVTPVDEPTAGRNYHQVGVRLRDGTQLNILFNAAESLVAAAALPDRRTVTLTFVDVPDARRLPPGRAAGRDGRRAEPAIE